MYAMIDLLICLNIMLGVAWFTVSLSKIERPVSIRDEERRRTRHDNNRDF